MPNQDDPNKIVELERGLVRALCSNPNAAVLWEIAAQRLNNYVWIDADSRVVFHALQKSREHTPAALRAQLRALVTRMGFPDVDWDLFLGPCELREAEVGAMVDALISQSARGT
ncbi:MAG: hypothetical protein WBP79_14590 [Candidatus Acidiferrales bacterium]